VLAIPLYVSATQINAIMPSDAPLGSDEMVVTYNGQSPDGYVIISGESLGVNGGAAGFNCTVDPSIGEFTVPATVLLALPPSAVNNSDGCEISEGWLQVGTVGKPSVFEAAGLGMAQATASFSVGQNFAYQQRKILSRCARRAFPRKPHTVTGSPP
jgi:uncharacterized protein (TIGR03437 family)